MTEPISEWITKAEGDFEVAQREFSRKGERNCDAVCFHAQQCVEKLMKAALIVHGVAPEYTHNLVYLDTCLNKVVESWNPVVEDLNWLTRAGVAFRYPGEWATDDHAEKAMRICTEQRIALLKHIHLDRDDSK